MEAVAAESILADDGVLQDGWLDTLPEDTFEKDDTGALKRGDLADHKNLPSILKSYINKDKVIGKAIHPLPENPTDEQVKAYRGKVGCPENVEGYEVVKPDVPEGMAFDDELLKSCAKYAHDNHMPKGVFEGLAKMVIDGQVATFKSMVEQATKDSEAAIETATNELKGKHGAKYDEVVETANRFYTLPGDDAVNKAFTDLLEEHGLNNHPAVLDFFYESYKLVKEDEVPEGGAGGGKTAMPGQLDYSTVVGDSGR